MLALGNPVLVLDPALGLATDIFPCEDGHACIAFPVARGVRDSLFSTLKGVLASVHGSDCREKLSYYYLGEELDATYHWSLD